MSDNEAINLFDEEAERGLVGCALSAEADPFIVAAARVNTPIFARRVMAAAKRRRALAALLLAGAGEEGPTDGERIVLLSAAYVLDRALDPDGPRQAEAVRP